MQLYNFSDANRLNSDLAEQISTLLDEAITLRGRAYLVVSGGKTPIELFKLLAQKEVSWDKVTITLADERCVSIHDPDRNERLVNDFLLQHKAHQAQFISLYNEHISIKENLESVEPRLDSLPAFDVVILGMGEDGHTASLFPCSDELKSGLDDEAQALLLVHPRSAPYPRISLSKRRLLNSRKIFIHLVGQKKRTVLSQALEIDNPKVMPISAFIKNQNANIQVMYAPQ